MANDVAAALPQVDLAPGSTITVTLSDAAAKITAFSLHGFQADPDSAAGTPIDPLTGAYTSGG